MRPVFTSRISMELHLRKLYLESHGIRARIENEALLSARPELPVDAHLVVMDESQEDAARDLLLQFEVQQQTPGDAWTCPKCSELLEAQFTDCWNCGFSKTSKGDE